MTAAMHLRRQTWLVTAFALVVLIAVNAYLQPNLFQPNVLQSNLTTFLPLILVAIGQTYVVLAGDIDLSVGSIAALVKGPSRKVSRRTIRMARPVSANRLTTLS